MFKKLFIITTLLIGICSFASCSDDDEELKTTKQTTTGIHKIDVNSLCIDDQHPHIVDLGLPSGTRWLCCNRGTNLPTEYGDYYKDVNNFDLSLVFDNKVTAHLPTIEQYEELYKGCSSEWVQVDEVYGQLFTGGNGHKIFFPAAGIYFNYDPTSEDNVLISSGYWGYYWTSTAAAANVNYYFHVGVSGSHCGKTDGQTSNGMSVRLVFEK